MTASGWWPDAQAGLEITAITEPFVDRFAKHSACGERNLAPSDECIRDGDELTHTNGTLAR